VSRVIQFLYYYKKYKITINKKLKDRLSGLKDFVPTAIPEDDPAEEECHIVCGEAHDGGGVNEVAVIWLGQVLPLFPA